MKLTDLIKQMNLDSERGSVTSDTTSRKGSVTGLIEPFNQMNIESDRETMSVRSSQTGLREEKVRNCSVNGQL